MWRFLVETLAVASKDLRAEFRTRVALNALGLFALTTLAAVAYTIGPYRIAGEDRPFLLSTLLWIVLFFATMAGLDRCFVREEEGHTAPLLRLAAAPHVVWAGKLVYNVVLLAVMMAVLVPLYGVLMQFEVTLAGSFVAVLCVGGYGLAVTTTIVAALVSRAMTRGALFAVMSLPLLLPLLILVIQGSAAAAEGDGETVRQALLAITGYSGVMTVVSALLFPVVWSE